MSTELTVREAELVSINEERSRFMPLMQIGDLIARRQAIVEMTRQVMTKDVDYGKIPGTDKDVLLKPGAEKLCSMFGLSPDFSLIERTEDWSGEAHSGEPFFYYFYKCRLLRNGFPVGEGEGSCNSRESKYRWRWVQENDLPANANKDRLVMKRSSIVEPTFAVDKAETGGKYGKPLDYWQRFRDAIASGAAMKVEKVKRDGGKMWAWEIASTAYRVPNPDVADQVNTLQKMAQKRALIAATLIAVNASEFFTQDLEDIQPPAPPGPPLPESDDSEAPPRSETHQQLVDRRIEEEKAKVQKKAPSRYEAMISGMEEMRKILGEAIYEEILTDFELAPGCELEIPQTKAGAEMAVKLFKRFASARADKEIDATMGIAPSDIEREVEQSRSAAAKPKRGFGGSQ
jgi:hypothetical protein